MFSLLKSKEIRGWCLFDFAISSFPTLILTFFYGAFYAKKIASDEIIGTSLWGIAISFASVLSFLLLAFLLFAGQHSKLQIKVTFFKFFFYLLIIFSFGLIFFSEGSNQVIPLLFVVVSFISFEFVNLFYNVTLYKIQKKKEVGALSNLGWAFGYLGGLLSLLFIFIIIQISSSNDFIIFGVPVLLMIGPFVAGWTFVFGMPHFKNLGEIKFSKLHIPNLLENLRSSGLTKFMISYFFFNNAVISIFAFASMFSAFLFGLSESQILFLGVFINLFGIVGCITIGRFEDKIGSLKTVIICILSLFIVTCLLFWVENVWIFLILSLVIGFFIGPIQASSRSVLVKKINVKNQLSAFSLYAIFGNMCSILGPLSVGVLIDLSGSIRYGILIIPLFFALSLVPFIGDKKINV